MSRKIQSVGIDLSLFEFRAVEAGVKLLNIYQYQRDTVVVEPHQWFEVYGVEKHIRQKSGSIQYNHRERVQSFEALRSIAARPMFFFYRKRMDNGTWDVVEDIAQLMRVKIHYHNLATVEMMTINTALDASRLTMVKAIEITFHPIFFDQIAQHYIYRPSDIYTRVRLAAGGKRLPEHLNQFIVWLLSDGEKRRRDIKRGVAKDWVISTPLQEVAHFCRLTDRLRHGERSRVLSELKTYAEFVKKIGLIFDHKFTQDDLVVITLNGSQLLGDVNAVMHIGDNGAEEHESGNLPKSLKDGVLAILEHAQQVHPVVSQVMNLLVPEGAGAGYKEGVHIQKAIGTIARKFLDADVVISKFDLGQLFAEVAKCVNTKPNLSSVGRYFDKVLQVYVEEHWDELKRKSRRLHESASSSKRGEKIFTDVNDILNALAGNQGLTPRGAAPTPH